MIRVVANDPTSRDIKTLGVASRPANQHIGFIQCRHCGGNLGSLARIAAVIGVSSSTLSKWLKREAVRPDIAGRIRSAFWSIEE